MKALKSETSACLSGGYELLLVASDEDNRCRLAGGGIIIAINAR